MKRMVRISILMIGLVGTYALAAAFDGGPIPLCPPTIQQVLHGSNGGNPPTCKPNF
ncbi:MAG TPA: hypothetical protein VMU61_00530 [Candidatus Aquilonibacter sp.]|nr:hypothetical protein [Candidatus Aquilonibacter sp.]